MSPHYLVKCRPSIHWLFVTILLRNFLFKQLRCELKISKSMDFYCFLNFFTPKLYRFPHKKWVALKSWLLGGWVALIRAGCYRCLWKELVGVMWQLELLVSEKISKQLWFQAFSCTLTLCSFYWKIARILGNLWVIYLEKSLFGISQGSTVTYFRWGGQIYNRLV